MSNYKNQAFNSAFATTADKPKGVPTNASLPITQSVIVRTAAHQWFFFLFFAPPPFIGLQ